MAIREGADRASLQVAPIHKEGRPESWGARGTTVDSVEHGPIDTGVRISSARKFEFVPRWLSACVRTLTVGGPARFTFWTCRADRASVARRDVPSSANIRRRHYDGRSMRRG
jgi:hypothetical protein